MRSSLGNPVRERTRGEQAQSPQQHPRLQQHGFGANNHSKQQEPAGRGHQPALADVREVIGRYEVARSSAQPALPVGTSPWTPIYNETLEELEAEVWTAGDRYDRTADVDEVAAAGRYDWRTLLR